MPSNNLLFLHEAIVIALINQPNRMASFENIAKFIEDRKLYPIRKGNISLAKQVMLRATKAKGAYHHLFEQLGPDHIMLRDTEYKRPILLSKALDEILNLDYYFYHPLPVKLRVYDESVDLSLEKELSPERVICIKTKDLQGKHGEKRSGRKKFVYYEGVGLNGNMEVYEYQVNGSMADLKHKLDEFDCYLATVSDNAVVNVGYFELSKGRTVVLKKSIPQLYSLASIQFSESRKAKEYLRGFEKVQSYYKSRMSLQKKILDYKNQISTDPNI